MTLSEQLIIAFGPWPFAILWSAWLIYWGVSARSAKRNEGVESGASRRSHMLPVVIGALVTVATQREGIIFALRCCPQN